MGWELQGENLGGPLSSLTPHLPSPTQASPAPNPMCHVWADYEGSVGVGKGLRMGQDRGVPKARNLISIHLSTRIFCGCG